MIIRYQFCNAIWNYRAKEYKISILNLYKCEM